MIQTIIVDDEYLIRYAIRNAVNWGELGYEIMGEAENGQDALDKIRRLHPDLVLLDLNLPIMDGIEVCRQIQQQNLNTTVIVLTGYNDFKSIQQCLRLGVFDYVVKPIEQQELSTALKKARKHIKSKKESFDTLEDVYSKTNRILASRTQPLYIALAEIDYLKKNYPSADAQSDAIDSVACLITEFSSGKDFPILCSRYENQILLCFPECLEKIEKSVPILQNQVSDHLGLSLSIGLCVKPPETGEINDCIEIAQDALAQKFYAGTSVFLKEMKKTQYNSSFQIKQSHLQNLLLKGQNREFMVYIEDSLSKAINMKISKDRFILLCAVIINTVLDFSSSLQVQIDAELKSQFCISTYLNCYETAKEIKQALLRSCSLLIQQFIRKYQIKPQVQEVIEYVKNHYSEYSLSSSSVAKSLSVSSNYLSKLFRQELGITITEYITKIRISEAVALIDESENISISELANAVGYSDSFYFSKIFRKLKGTSPSDYIRITKQGKK